MRTPCSMSWICVEFWHFLFLFFLLNLLHKQSKLFLSFLLEKDENWAYMNPRVREFVHAHTPNIYPLLGSVWMFVCVCRFFLVWTFMMMMTSGLTLAFYSKKNSFFFVFGCFGGCWSFVCLWVRIIFFCDYLF